MRAVPGWYADGIIDERDAAIARAEAAERERDQALAALARVNRLLSIWRDLDIDDADEWTGSRRDACESLEASLKGPVTP